MMNETRTRRDQSVSKSGFIPRPVFDSDPSASRETAPAPSHMEAVGEGAATGIIPAVMEGRDATAARDDDHGEDSSK